MAGTASMPFEMHWTSDTRRTARYGSYAFGIGGVISIVGAWANAGRLAEVGGSATPILGAGTGAIAVALVIPRLPWAKWNPRVAIVLPFLGLVMLMIAELGSKSSRTADGAMGIQSVIPLIFVCIGLTQPQWWSLAFAPIAALALSVVLAVVGAPVSIVTVLAGVFLSAIVGELVAWVKRADETRNDELGLMIDGASGLRNETDQADAARRLAETVVALLRVPNVAVYLAPRREPESVVGAGGRAPDGGDPTDRHASHQFVLAARVGENQWPERRPSDAGTGLSVSAVDAGVELVIPLVGRSGGLRGVVVTAGRRRQDEFMLRLAQILGEQAGYRLDDLDAIDALTDETRRDPLTGVGNRRHGDELLRTLRPRDVVVVLDLDDLRGINARSGHHGGDAAIRSVARYLADTVRQADGVARMGGDEFVMVLRDVGTEAFVLVQRIANEWNAENPTATFSVGAAVYSGEDPEVTLRSADAALFRAKRDGRARAQLAPAPPPGEIRDVSGF